MTNKILENLEKIDKNRYDELSILFAESKNTKDFFLTKYNDIMQKWNKEYSEFDIPNILIGISINDEKSICSNTNKLNDNTIFDLASITKLYTEMILFDVIKDYDLSFNTKIKDITNLYRKINNLTIMDLISFNNTYRTDIDIRKCTNKADALKALREVYIVEEKKNYYLYTDLPIMILTDILEEYTKMSYSELFNKYIIQKYNLNNTFLEIDNDNYLTINKGKVNDPKANIFGGYYGHCGVKATCNDVMKFLNQVMKCDNLHLFTTISKTLDSNGNIKKSKGLIGNANLSVSDDNSLASIYLPNIGFAVQGSLRCHAELCKFVIDNKDYIVVTCIFTDLYTQEENIKNYEKNHNVLISNTIKLDDGNIYKMYDIRNILPYNGAYKEIVNLVSICKLLELYKYINNE